MIRPLPAIPMHPLAVFPPGLLSRTVSFFEKSPEARDVDSAAASFCDVLAAVLDLSRSVFGVRREEEVAVRIDPATGTPRLIYGDVQLSVRAANDLMKTVVLEPATSSPSYLSSTTWEGTRDAVLDYFERPSRKGTIHGLGRTGIQVLYNCPYYPAATAGSAHKWRFKIINMVSRRESPEAIDRFAEEVALHPIALDLVGWCGGVILHPCCRLGNLRQLEVLLKAVRSGNARRGSTIDQFVNWRNLDGCTPFFTARFYGQQEAAEMMINAGADPQIPDRFGYQVDQLLVAQNLQADSDALPSAL